MTTTINLLPWREARRKQRQQEFVAMLIFAALLAGLIFWLWKGVVEDHIAAQQTRNNHIQGEIAKLDKQIEEIKALQERRDQLVARMQVIQDLHARGKAVDLTHTLISPRAQGGPTALVETIDAAVSDGRHIDLMFVTNPEQLEGMYKLDRLLPVDEISRSDSGFSVDGYFPAAMQTVTFDGRAMGLPLWFRLITMSVNRQAFADAGVEIPAGDWDWHLSRNRPAPHQT